MKDVIFALPGIGLTILCWGAYGEILHKGQAGLGNDKLKPLICVGAAYLIVAIIVPVVVLSMAGKLSGGWTFSGTMWSMMAGAAGACGALGIILALTSGGSPIYVMPLVFGGAPIVNVIIAMWAAKIPWKSASPFFYAGLIMVVVGATFVLMGKPKPVKSHSPPEPQQATSDVTESESPAEN
jgi:hypothetical protein